MIVEIKQHADQSAYAIGLEKYNRSKLPSTFEQLYPAKGEDGRWITGVDEDSITINSITDPLIKAERKEEILKLRKELEELINVDLSNKNNEYWSNFKIILRDNVTLNFTKPLDKLKYYVLIANGYAAPEIGAVNNPDYMNTKYYVSRKDEETKGRMVTKKTKDQARAKLLEISKDYNKLLLIGKHLLGSRRVKDGISEETIYEEISNYIDDPKDTRNVSVFLEATKKTVEELQYKLVVDEAVRLGLIKIREGYYQRGNATYGKTLKETIEYLSSVEHSSEFASLKEEVETV